MDPSTRHFSEDQWEEAYSAYKQSRKRLNKGNGGESRSSSRRRKKVSSGRSKSSGSDVSPQASVRREPSEENSKPRSPGRLASKLRSEVRRDSAYRDLRLIVNVLAWAAITLVVLSIITKWFYFTDIPVALDAGLSGALKIALVCLLRLLAHVFIDIPDIALHKRASEHFEVK